MPQATLLNRRGPDVDPGALHREGVRLHLQGRHAAAIACLEAALRAAPANASTWSDLGVAQAAIGGLQTALNCYDRAIALDPGHCAALNNRGNALAGLGSPSTRLRATTGRSPSSLISPALTTAAA